MEEERGKEEDREKEEKKKTGRKEGRREREKVGSVSITGTNARGILQARPPDSPRCTQQLNVHGAEDGRLSPLSHPSHHD